MRRSVLALALVAAPLAAKPGLPRDAAQARYRVDALARCTSQLGEAEGADADQVEALCSCAADRFVAARDTAALPAFGPAGMPAGMGSEVLNCLAEVRPDAAGALAAEAMRQSAAVPSPPVETAVASPDKPHPGEAAPAPSGPGLLDRLGSAFDRLSVSGLPRWAWGVIALLGLLMLRRRFRRPERDDDLMGPPRPDRYRNLPRY